MVQAHQLVTATGYVAGFRHALDDEIVAAKSGGGRGAFVSDGRYLGKRDAVSMYSFSAETELCSSFNSYPNGK